MKHVPLGSVAWRLAAIGALFAVLACAGPMTGMPPVAGALSPQHSTPIEPAVTKQAAWQQTYYNALHTGYNALETTLNSSNVSGLKAQWGASIAGGVQADAISGNTLFAYTGPPNPSSTNSITALDLATHAQKWTTGLGGGGLRANSTTIAVSSGKVFAVCGSMSNNGVCAYSAKTGGLLWSYAPGGPSSSANQAFTYDSGAVYVGMRFYYQSNNGLYAINATNGTVLWSNTTHMAVDNGDAPAVGNGYVYYNCLIHGAPPWQDGVCALNQTDGSLAWAVTVNGGGDAGYVGITVAKGVVYAHTAAQVGSQCCAGEVFALNASTGAQIWANQYQNNIGGTSGDALPVALAKGKLYVMGLDSNLYALKATTGAVVWKQAYGAGGNFSAPTVANGVVYANGAPNCGDGGHCNSTVAYDASSGKVLWTAPSSDSTFNPPPIVLNGALYVANVNYMSTPCNLCVYGLTASRKRPQ